MIDCVIGLKTLFSQAYFGLYKITPRGRVDV